MKRLIGLFGIAVVLAAVCHGQGGIIHGNGDPRTLTPTPNCASSRFYVDDSTGVMYQANTGSPCVWSPAGGQGTFVPFVGGPIYASAYGVHADTVSIHDASTTNGSAVITCPNSDCQFSAADVGKVIFATNATYDSTEWNSVVIVARSTIVSVANANSVTVSNNATASETGTATVIYGTLDSAPSTATQTIANDPLFAAWSAASAACLPLQLPAGMLLVEQAEFDTYPTTASCASLDAQYNNRRGWTVRGYGIHSTIIVITPALPAADCTGPNGTGNGCFFSVPSITLDGLQLWGGGNSSPGTGFNGKVGILIPGAGVGVNFFFYNVDVHGWGTAQTGFQGINVGNGVSSGVSNGWFFNLNQEAFGYSELVINPGFNNPGGAGGQIFMTQSYVVTGRSAVEIISGALNSSNNLFGQGTGSNVVQVDAGAEFFSDNDQWQFGASGTASMLSDQGTAWVTNGYVNQTIASSYACAAGSGGVLYLVNTTCHATTAADAIYVGGTLYDGGNNIFNGSTVAGGTVYGSTSITGVAAASSNIALSAGWGSTAASSAFGGSASPMSFTITNGGTGQAANPTITYTFPKPYIQAPLWCSATDVGGTNTILSFTAGTPTATSVVLTAVGTPVVGDTEVMQVICPAK